MNTTNTIGFVSALTLIFIVLRLTGVIEWSWLWVLSPLWILAIVSFTLLILIVIIAAIITHFENKRSNDE